MDNLVKFLLEYYIWILIVLGVIIVTIIGFLVDSKQKRKKKELNNVSDEVKTVEPLPEVNDLGETPIVDVTNQNIPNSVDTLASENANLINNVQVKEQNQSFNSNVQGGSFNDNQSLSLNEQKPHFEPRNVAIPQANEIGNNIIAPRPVNAVPITQPTQQNTSLNVQSNIMPGVQYSSSTSNPTVSNQYYQNNNNLSGQYSQQSLYNNQAVSPSLSGSNVSNQVVSPVVGGANVNNQQSLNQATTNPMYSQTANVIPNIQPVMQQPIQNNQQMMGTQQPSSMPNYGINFVTGENDKPSNDDTWDL